MIKKLFKSKSAKSIAKSYTSYSDYARNASKYEKQRVIKDAVKNANKLQQEIASPVN
jgi:hypothetical protein